MSLSSDLTIAQLNPDGSVPVPTAPDAAANAAAEALQREAQFEALQTKVDDLQEILAKPLSEILATGLHAYLTQFLDRVNDLGGGISRDFLVAAGD